MNEVALQELPRRAGLEPRGPNIKRNLLISLIDKNAQIVPSADLRYTAGTRATNSLVVSGAERDRSCVCRETREPRSPGEHRD